MGAPISEVVIAGSPVRSPTSATLQPAPPDWRGRRAKVNAVGSRGDDGAIERRRSAQVDGHEDLGFQRFASRLKDQAVEPSRVQRSEVGDCQKASETPSSQPSL